MIAAVSEVDRETNDKPDDQPNPSRRDASARRGEAYKKEDPKFMQRLVQTEGQGQRLIIEASKGSPITYGARKTELIARRFLPGECPGSKWKLTDPAVTKGHIPT